MGFRMKLDCPDATLLICNTRKSMIGLRRQGEAGSKLNDTVAMRHPDIQLCRQASKELRLGDHIDRCIAILTLVSGNDFATKVMRDELHAVADAECRKA